MRTALAVNTYFREGIFSVHPMNVPVEERLDTHSVVAVSAGATSMSVVVSRAEGQRPAVGCDVACDVA